MGSWLAPLGSFAALSDSELTTTNRAMMRIDSLSTSVGKSFAWLILVLTVAMTYKVFVRYALNAPIAWAFDFSYITCGALFLMAGAYTLSRNAHVRGDFLYRSWWPCTQASRRDPKPVAEGEKGARQTGLVPPRRPDRFRPRSSTRRTRARSSSPARTARSSAAGRKWRCRPMATLPRSMMPAWAGMAPTFHVWRPLTGAV